jgi:hypothetical protein
LSKDLPNELVVAFVLKNISSAIYCRYLLGRLILHAYMWLMIENWVCYLTLLLESLTWICFLSLFLGSVIFNIDRKTSPNFSSYFVISFAWRTSFYCPCNVFAMFACSKNEQFRYISPWTFLLIENTDYSEIRCIILISLSHLLQLLKQFHKAELGI